MSELDTLIEDEDGLGLRDLPRFVLSRSEIPRCRNCKKSLSCLTLEIDS